MSADHGPLMARLKHCFGRPEILVRALTHKSYAYENAPTEVTPDADNEQLEFLGDAILGQIVSEVLVARYPLFPEGRLTKLRGYLVSSNHLYKVAQRIGLGEYLLLGRGEEVSGGREKKTLLADALEAVIAALYIDAGFETVRRFVVSEVVGEFDADHAELPVVDYKSALQEKAQKLKLSQPRYTIVEQHGPEHKKTFVVEVRIGKHHTAHADGASKKDAGQKAAKILLHQLENPVL